MKVSLGMMPGPLGGMIPNETEDISHESFSVVFRQDANRTNQRLEIYFMEGKPGSSARVGRITLSPFEFGKIREQAMNLLSDNGVTL